MREEVIASVQLIYDRPAEASLSAQSDMIHEDIVRLLDADSTTVVQLRGLTIQHVQSEAITHGNTEPSSEKRKHSLRHGPQSGPPQGSSVFSATAGGVTRIAPIGEQARVATRFSENTAAQQSWRLRRP